jgi:hypothetical protein
MTNGRDPGGFEPIHDHFVLRKQRTPEAPRRPPDTQKNYTDAISQD